VPFGVTTGGREVPDGRRCPAVSKELLHVPQRHPRFVVGCRARVQNLIPTGERHRRASHQLKHPNPGRPDQPGTRRKPNNVLNLALRLGVPAWVAPLVAPVVDLSILGLLLGIRHLALYGATADQLRPARRLLIFASVALNVADPIVAGNYGKAVVQSAG
jgi:hypothetical protein